MKRSIVLATLAAAVLSPALWADTFTVTNTDDSGTGSLRQAMLDSNASAGVVDTIAFAIPGDGVHTIALLSALRSQRPRSWLSELNARIRIAASGKRHCTGAMTVCQRLGTASHAAMYVASSGTSM